MILKALDDAGGIKYLREQTQKNPGAFLTLLGKVLPTTLTGPDGNEPLPCFTVRYVDHTGKDFTEEVERKRAEAEKPQAPERPQASSPGLSRSPAEPSKTPTPPWLN